MYADSGNLNGIIESEYVESFKLTISRIDKIIYLNSYILFEKEAGYVTLLSNLPFKFANPTYAPMSTWFDRCQSMLLCQNSEICGSFSENIAHLQCNFNFTALVRIIISIILNIYISSHYINIII